MRSNRNSFRDSEFVKVEIEGQSQSVEVEGRARPARQSNTLFPASPAGVASKRHGQWDTGLGRRLRIFLIGALYLVRYLTELGLK